MDVLVLMNEWMKQAILMVRQSCLRRKMRTSQSSLQYVVWEWIKNSEALSSNNLIESVCVVPNSMNSLLMIILEY